MKSLAFCHTLYKRIETFFCSTQEKKIVFFLLIGPLVIISSFFFLFSTTHSATLYSLPLFLGGWTCLTSSQKSIWLLAITLLVAFPLYHAPLAQRGSWWEMSLFFASLFSLCLLGFCYYKGQSLLSCSMKKAKEKDLQPFSSSHSRLPPEKMVVQFRKQIQSLQKEYKNFFSKTLTCQHRSRSTTQKEQAPQPLSYERMLEITIEELLSEQLYDEEQTKQEKAISQNIIRELLAKQEAQYALQSHFSSHK